MGAMKAAHVEGFGHGREEPADPRDPRLTPSCRRCVAGLDEWRGRCCSCPRGRARAARAARSSAEDWMQESRRIENLAIKRERQESPSPSAVGALLRAVLRDGPGASGSCAGGPPRAAG